jgi:hypothetical protein
MIQAGADVRVIDKTQAGRFLLSREFKEAFSQVASEASLDRVWANVTDRFLAETKGAVRFLGPVANFGRQFGQRELKAILDGLTGVTSIEGFSIAELKLMGVDTAFSAIKVRSAWHAGLSGFSIKAVNGVIQSLTIGDFLNPAILDSKAYILSKPESLARFVKFISEGLASGERSILKGMASGVFKHLGLLGGLMSLGFAVSDSAEAAQKGDSAKAVKIIEHWAIDAAGSGLGAAALGAAIVGIAAVAPEFDIKTPILRFWRSRLHMNQRLTLSCLEVV